MAIGLVDLQAAQGERGQRQPLAADRDVEGEVRPSLHGVSHAGRLAKRVVTLATRGGVGRIGRAPQHGGVGTDGSRQGLHRGAFARHHEHQCQRRQALEGPEPAEEALPQRLAPQGRVDHQPGAAAGLRHHGVAQCGAVHLFVAEALALWAHHPAARPGRRRRDEAPGRNVVQAAGLGAHTLPQAQATAVAARPTDGPTAAKARRMLFHQLRVVDVPAGGQHHAAVGTQQTWAGLRLLDAGGLLPASIGATRLEDAPLGHQRVQRCVACFARGIFVQRPGLHAQDAAGALLAHQSAHGGLRERAGTAGDSGCLQGGIQHGARLPTRHGPVAARGRLGLAHGVSRHRLVARVVEEHAIRRVRGLVVRHGGGKAHAVLLQPRQVVDTLAAEAPQRLITHHPLGFVSQVLEHGRG